MTTTPLRGSRPTLRPLLISLALALAAASVARAQEMVLPQTGDRIRVTVRDGQSDANLRYVGNLGGWDALLIRWDSDGTAYDAPLERVTKLELSQGTRSNWRKGGAIGAAAGFAAGFVVVAIACSGNGCYDSGPNLNYAFAGGAVGAGAGLLVGGLIGSNSRTERWSEVSSSAYRRSSSAVARLPN